MVSVRRIVSLSALLILISGNVHAGNKYDKCIKDEKFLKAEEVSNCTGFNYVFNPNACFATRKELKTYSATDKCRKIGIAENVDFNTPLAVPTEKADIKKQVDINKAAPEVQPIKNVCEQLKNENVFLKDEINRLKIENDQLRKTGR